MSAVHLPPHPRRLEGGTISPKHRPVLPDRGRNRADPNNLRRGRMAAVAGLVALLLVAGTAIVIAARPHSAAPAQRSVPSLAGAGAVVQTASTGQLLVRRPANRFIAVTHPRVVTADGHSLAASSIRQGDTVSLVHGQIVDASQTQVTIQGLVAAAPDPLTDTMIVQLSTGRQVVVDLSSATRINGTRFSPTSPLSLTVADEVRLTGTFNSRVGEMTTTESVLYSSPRD